MNRFQQEKRFLGPEQGVMTTPWCVLFRKVQYVYIRCTLVLTTRYTDRPSEDWAPDTVCVAVVLALYI